MDRSDLKVESNHWGRAIAPFEPCDIPTGLIGLKLHYYRKKSIVEKKKKVASLGNRLHLVGYRNVTMPLKTCWITPAGLFVFTQ